MPVYKILVEGRPRKIEIKKTGEDIFEIKADDKNLKIELPDGKIDFDKGFPIKIEGKTYEVEILKVEWDKIFPVKVEEATFKAELKTSNEKPALTVFEPTHVTPSKKTVTTRQVAEDVVTAPMTGRILSVKVKKGEQVKVGQVLCILEAMKMENEIVAPKAGAVQEVYASEGSSVSEGEPLFSLA